MTALRRYWLALLFAGCAFVIAGLSYGRLPERIAVHWNLNGNADGWMPRLPGAFAVPLATLILTGLMIFVAPKAASESGSIRRVYPTIVAAVSAFFLYLTIMFVSLGMGMDLSVPSYISIGLGIVLIVVGNSAGKITRNEVLGIRTPWTLANEEVWSRTHRLGGWLLLLAGLVLTICGLVGEGLAFAVSSVVAACVVPVVYSYVLARRLEG